MISKVAWDNISWLRTAFLNQLEHIGGSYIAVDALRPYLKRSWVQEIEPGGARQQLFEDIEKWAAGIKKKHLFKVKKLKRWEEGFRLALGGSHYSEHIGFLLRTHYNLYCLATHRKTIEELALGAYAYCSRTVVHTREFDKRALADFRRLIRLSKTFLLAEWVQDIIARAVANRNVPLERLVAAGSADPGSLAAIDRLDQTFFKVLSNSLTSDIMVDTSPAAIQWLMVVLLWFLGGKDYPTRRRFLHDLHQHGILPRSIDELTFNVELRRLGLTRTSP